MKKTVLAVSILCTILLNSGCSSTWDGVKDDSAHAWDETKKAVNKATDD